MLVLTWNMGHRGPGIRRGDPKALWSLVEEYTPDIVFAQEAPSPELAGFGGYEIAFRPVSARHIGYVVAVRHGSGELDTTDVSTHRDDLAAWGNIAHAGEVLLTSTRVDAQRNPNQALDRAVGLAGASPLLLAGDFNAGPSIGSHNPCVHAQAVGLQELSSSQPESNTVRMARQSGDHQVDHVFGRGMPEPRHTLVVPVTENDGPLWSYHNPVLVELS